MKRGKTKFEQIPVELAKKLATEVDSAERRHQATTPASSESEPHSIHRAIPFRRRRSLPAETRERSAGGAGNRRNEEGISSSLSSRERYAMRDHEPRPSGQWKRLYEDAVLELDGSKLLQRITDAERALMERMEGIRRSGYDESEHLALKNAMTVLRDLRNMAKDASHQVDACKTRGSNSSENTKGDHLGGHPRKIQS